MTTNTRKDARPCTPADAQHPPTLPPSSHNYAAQMAVDCIIALALFKAVPWLEIEITRATLSALGNRPRRSCACGVAIRLTRERARLEGWPWPSFGEVITQMAMAEFRKGDAR